MEKRRSPRYKCEGSAELRQEGPGVLPPRLAGAGDPELAITNAGAAMAALVEFFQNRHMLTRAEFIAVVRKSQSKP